MGYGENKWTGRSYAILLWIGQKMNTIKHWKHWSISDLCHKLVVLLWGQQEEDQITSLTGSFYSESRFHTVLDLKQSWWPHHHYLRMEVSVGRLVSRLKSVKFQERQNPQVWLMTVREKQGRTGINSRQECGRMKKKKERQRVQVGNVLMLHFQNRLFFFFNCSSMPLCTPLLITSKEKPVPHRGSFLHGAHSKYPI